MNITIWPTVSKGNNLCKLLSIEGVVEPRRKKWFPISMSSPNSIWPNRIEIQMTKYSGIRTISNYSATPSGHMAGVWAEPYDLFWTMKI